MRLDDLTEMLKGVLEGCVLEIISRKQTYGYDITRQLHALGFTDVVDGTVYTILVRLEKNRLVDVEKKPSDMGPPRKFFALNDAGREELRRFWAKWEFVASKINELKEVQRMSGLLEFVDEYFNFKRIAREKREFRQKQARANALPEDYRYVYHKIQHYMWGHSGGVGYGHDANTRRFARPVRNGRGGGQAVLDVTGEDVAAFCDELLRNAKTWTGKQRTRR